MAHNPITKKKRTPDTNGSLGKLSFISLKKAYTCRVQQIKTPKKVVSETFVFGVQSFDIFTIIFASRSNCHFTNDLKT